MGGSLPPPPLCVEVGFYMDISWESRWGIKIHLLGCSDSNEITSFSSLFFFLGYCCIMQVRFCLCLESRIVHSILKKILKRYKKTRKITGINISNIWIYLVEQIKKWWHDVKNFLTFQIIHFLSWQLSFMWLPFQKISWINHVFCSLILLKLNSNHDLTLCKSIY